MSSSSSKRALASDLGRVRGKVGVRGRVRGRGRGRGRGRVRVSRALASDPGSSSDRCA